MTDLTFFNQIWAWQQEVFSLLYWRKGHEKIVFWENWRFLTKYGNESILFFRERTFSWQYMEMRADIFRGKSEKKDVLFTFLTHYKKESVVLTEFLFFWPTIGMTANGFFMKNLDKMTFSTMFLRECTLFDKIWKLEHCVFERPDVFWQNIGMKAVVFTWKIRKKGILLTFWPKI